jgi:hypothetical protein
MAIDLTKLEKVRQGPDGGHRARCPACASSGEDKRGEHLYIRKDGRFGCAKYPKDKTHRSKIAKLAGDGRRSVGVRRTMPKVQLRLPKPPKHTPKGILGTNGTPFYNPRACREKFLRDNIAIANKTPASEIGLKKPVPFVPNSHKPLSINKSNEIKKTLTPVNPGLVLDESVISQIDRIKSLFDADIVAATDGVKAVGEWGVAA